MNLFVTKIEGDGPITIGAASSPGGSASTVREHSVGDLMDLAQRFVTPRGLGKARKVLETRRTVLIHGAPGSGRITAAKMLVYELAAGHERFHELGWDEDKKRGTRFHVHDILTEDRMWLDLSQAHWQILADFHQEFAQIRKAVLDQRALLAVVLPPDDTIPLPAEFDHYRVELQRPPGLEVLRGHLRFHGVPEALDAQASRAIAERLRSVWRIEDIARFAKLVAMARENAAGTGGLTAWFTTALKASLGHKHEARIQIAKMTQSRQRALLLATAMLHGGYADHIHAAAGRLLQVMKQPREESPPLEQEDLLTQFMGIGARIDGEGFATFRELEFDAAVRAHFWDYVPDLREGIRSWVRQMIDSAELRQEDRDALVTRFTQLCMRDRYLDVLTKSIKEWSADGATERRLRAAEEMLRQAVGSERHGRFFRRQTYEWSRDSQLSTGLSRAVVRACAEVMAVHRPYEAMVRLHHRARRERGGDQARRALAALVQGDPRLRRQMLFRLTRLSQKYPRDPVLFLDIADPQAFTKPDLRDRSLIAEDGVREMLRDGWRRVFTDCPAEIWTPRVVEWVSHAFHDEGHRDAVLAVLLGGSDARNDVLACLFNAARRLPDAPEDAWERRIAFRDLVLRKISEAQGLEVA